MPIDITDVTNLALQDGAFDLLMIAINDHLDKQFDLNRITGSDYATVYLGAMQVALQESIKFVQIQADNEIQESQSVQDLALKQAQQDLVEQQALAEQANVVLVNQKAANAIIEGEILVEQVLKVAAEAKLLEQKHVTEYAQTSQTIAGATPSGSAADGLVGAQTDLYTFQTNGFKYKAAFDALKSLTDMWSIGVTQGEAMPQSTDSGSSKNILQMVEQMYNAADDPDPQFSVAIF